MKHTDIDYECDVRVLQRDQDRLAMFEVSPLLFIKMMNRRVELRGLPADVQYVRSWHNPETDLFAIVVRSESFDHAISGILPYRITVQAEEVPS